MSQRMLLVGGAGFIGTHLARRLAREGHEITVVDALLAQVHGTHAKFSSELRAIANCVKADVRRPAALRRMLHEHDVIYWLAAETGTGQSMYRVRRYTDTNLGALATLFDVLVKNRGTIERIVLSSSRAIYGEGAYVCSSDGGVVPRARTGPLPVHGWNPVCPLCDGPIIPLATPEESPHAAGSIYGWTKAGQEQILGLLATATGLDCRVLRFQNVYGPGQSLRNPYTGVLMTFCNRALAGDPLILFEDGEITRDFVHVDDAVAALAVAGVRGPRAHRTDQHRERCPNDDSSGRRIDPERGGLVIEGCGRGPVPHGRCALRGRRHPPRRRGIRFPTHCRVRRRNSAARVLGPRAGAGARPLGGDGAGDGGSRAPQDRPMIAVVIVNWNGRRLLDSCLQAVFAQTPAAELVIVVDNGSTDGSMEHLASRLAGGPGSRSRPKRGRRRRKQRGDRAALDAGARYILLLNNDATLGSGVIGELCDALTEAGDRAWAAAPKILYRSQPDRIWSAGGSFEWWRGVSRDRGTDERDRGQYDDPADIDYSNTCCLLIKAEAFARVGLMDEAYFMYYDDSDFSARLRRAGGRIRYVPTARVLHDVQASSGGAADRPSLFALYYTTRNRARFIRRNAPTLLHRIIAHCFTIGTRMTRIGQALARGRWQEARLVGGALRDGYLRRETGPSPRRAIS